VFTLVSSDVSEFYQLNEGYFFLAITANKTLRHTILDII